MTYTIDINVPSPVNVIEVLTKPNGGTYSVLISYVYSPGSFPRTEQATLVVPVDNDHVVNNLLVNSICGIVEQYGDIRYLYNPIATPCTFVPNAGPVIDIEWTPLCNVLGDSVLEYILSYKVTGSPSAPTQITIPIITVITDPYYIANGVYQMQLTALDGIVAATSYDISLGTTLQFKYDVDPLLVDPLGYILVNQSTAVTSDIVITP